MGVGLSWGSRVGGKVTLVCPHCGHSIDLDDYGREGNEEYENLYPTREEVLGIANDDSEEDSDD